LQSFSFSLSPLLGIFDCDRLLPWLYGNGRAKEHETV